MTSTDLQKRTALIVGGTGDIGHATAKLFVDAGARVIITGRQRARAEAKAQLLGPSARGHAVSRAEESDLRRFFGEVGAFDYLLLTLGTQSITLPFAHSTTGTCATPWIQSTWRIRGLFAPPSATSSSQ